MATLKEDIKALMRPSTNIRRNTEIVSEITRRDIDELNNSIEPLIRRNERERIASEQAVASVIFGGIV